MMNPKIWSQREFITDFINLYKSRPCLWKATSEDYTNRIKKEEAYKELLEFCRSTDPTVGVDFVKNKINTIRTSYRKELTKITRSIKSGADRDNIYVPKLWYFSHLDFLREQDGLCLSRSSNLTVDDIAEIEEQSFETSSMLDEEEEDQRDSDYERTRNIMQQIASQGNYIKSTVVRNDKNLTKHKMSVTNTTDRFSNCVREQDEFDALGVSVSKKLRKMDRLQQLFTENLINKALFLGSMGQLNINSDVQPISNYDNHHSPSTSSTFNSN